MRRHHRGTLVLITAVFGLALLLGTFVNPMFRVFDERFHADLVLVGRDPGILWEEGWPRLGERSLSPGIVIATREQRVGRRTLEEADPRDRRPPFRAWEEREVRDRPTSTMTQHPPLYYLLVGSAVRVADLVVPGSFAYDVELWLGRVATILLLLPLPALGYLLARRLSDRPETWIASAAMPLLVPGLTLRNGPMINNDTLITALGGVFVYLLVRCFQEDGEPGSAAAAALVAGLAMLTKGFGLVLFGALAMLLLGLLVSRRADPSRRWRVVRSGALATVIGLGVGGWWYARSFLESGTLQPKAVDRPEIAGFEPDWLWWARDVLWRNWSDFWGGRYVLSHDTNTLLLGVLVAVTAVLVVVALGHTRGRRRRALLVALVPVALLALSVYAESALTYRAQGRTGGVHGRYLYGGLLGVTTAMAMGAGHLTGRLRAWLPAVVVAAGGLLYTIGLNSLLATSWGAPGSAVVTRLRAVGAWAGPPDGFVLAVGILFVATGLWLFARLATLAVPRP